MTLKLRACLSRYYCLSIMQSCRIASDLAEATELLRSGSITEPSTLLQLRPSPDQTSVLWVLLFFT